MAFSQPLASGCLPHSHTLLKSLCPCSFPQSSTLAHKKLPYRIQVLSILHAVCFILLPQAFQTYTYFRLESKNTSYILKHPKDIYNISMCFFNLYVSWLGGRTRMHITLATLSPNKLLIHSSFDIQSLLLPYRPESKHFYSVLPFSACDLARSLLVQ